MSGIFLHTKTKLYCMLLFRAVTRVLKRLFQTLLEYTLPLLVLGYLIFLAYILPGPHRSVIPKQYILLIEEISFFSVWWLGLGIASSIGFGSGLHTFILYLGPHIAKVAIISSECGFVPKQLPSRWSFQYFQDCNKQGDIEIMQIFWAVQLESVLWGFGTVIGEFPPYFIARGARDNEYEEDEEEGGRVKQILRIALKKYTFITLCLCASIPNPLFDLAGLMAGHFGVPFFEFFVATALGKTVVKVQMQVIFTTLLFSGNHLESIFLAIENKFPILGNIFTELLKKEKDSLFKSKAKTSSIIGILWEVFIVIMIMFFVISLLNTIVKREYVLFN